MPGVGPQVPPGERQPHLVDRDAAAAVAAQMYADGQARAAADVTAGGSPAGYRLGHDVGFGARNDTAARGFVVQVLAGHADGMDARRELVGDLINYGRSPDPAAARRRLAARGEPGGRAQAEQDTEMEAE